MSTHAYYHHRIPTPYGELEHEGFGRMAFLVYRFDYPHRRAWWERKWNWWDAPTRPYFRRRKRTGRGYRNRYRKPEWRATHLAHTRSQAAERLAETARQGGFAGLVQITDAMVTTTMVTLIAPH